MSDRDRFERMLEEDTDPDLWPLWQHAFLSAMNTRGSWRRFLRQIREGTALEWWKTTFREGVESGAIQPVGACARLLDGEGESE